MPNSTLDALPFLASLAQSENAVDQRLWLRIACDHFVAAPPADPARRARLEREIFARLANADAALGLDVARRLAPSPATPQSILTRIASLGEEAELVVLQHAPTLAGDALVRASIRGGRAAMAVASRRPLDPDLSVILSNHDDVDVVAALAANPGAPLRTATFKAMARRALWLEAERGDRRLADALLTRTPMRLEHAALFLLADPDQRLAILVAAQRDGLGRPAGAGYVEPAAAALEELESEAIARRPARFVEVLADALDLSQPLAQRIVEDSSGEPLAIALAALGGSNENLVRILIANDLMAGANYKRIGALARLKDALSPTAARLVVAAMRGEAARGAPRFVRRAVLDPGASASPARPAADASRDAPRQGVASIVRSRSAGHFNR